MVYKETNTSNFIGFNVENHIGIAFILHAMITKQSRGETCLCLPEVHLDLEVLRSSPLARIATQRLVAPVERAAVAPRAGRVHCVLPFLSLPSPLTGPSPQLTQPAKWEREAGMASAVARQME